MVVNTPNLMMIKLKGKVEDEINILTNPRYSVLDIINVIIVLNVI